MKILPNLVAFDWDKGNKDKNVIKHGVSNKEAEEIFVDRNILVMEDVEHSQGEKRLYAIGKTKKGRGKDLIFSSL